MPKSWATLRDEIEAELQDSANALWTTAELDIQMEDALRELSEYAPFYRMLTYEFETRTGRATATTTGALVDTTETQFRATDVDKVIFNTTDRTWAVVTAFVSTSQLTLSVDIMANTEKYEMYNRDCWNNRQIYIGDVEDFVGENHGVTQVEYKIGLVPPMLRNFEVDGDVLTVLLNASPPDSKDADAIIEVNITFATRQQVSQLTDLAGAVDLVAGYAADLTTIHVDALAATEVIAEDQEFTIASLRGKYRTTAAVTLAGNEADISFWPPLRESVADNDVVTFLGSSLTRDQERMVVALAAAQAAISKANQPLRVTYPLINTVMVGGIGTPGQYGELSDRIAEWGRARLARVLTDIRRSRGPTQSFTYTRS